MRAVILAAGFGNRLGLLTKERPKPLLVINQVPIIERAVRALHQANVKQIIVVVRRGSKVKDYLRRRFPTGLSFVYQNGSNDSTLEAFRSANEILENRPDNTILMFGDLVFSPSVLEKLVKRATKRDYDVLVGVDNQLTCDIKVRLSGNNVVQQMGKDLDAASSYCVGIFVFAPSVTKESNDTRVNELLDISEFVQILIEKGYAVRSFEMQNVYDVDTYEKLQLAERFIESSERER